MPYIAPANLGDEFILSSLPLSCLHLLYRSPRENKQAPTSEPFFSELPLHPVLVLPAFIHPSSLGTEASPGSVPLVTS